MSTTQMGDVQAALAAVEDARESAKVIPWDNYRVGMPLAPGWKVAVVDGEAELPHPRRASGSVRVHTVESFCAGIRRFGPPAGLGLYANLTSRRLTAILNDDLPGTPGWRDHRIELVLRETPEWETWKGGQGLKTQQVFAEHIEANIADIREPDGATMLTIAETFEAKSESDFVQGADLGFGRRQLTFKEVVNAKAGPGGSLTIPESMKLGVRLFVGESAGWEVTAAVRFRLRDGKLTIGYTLVRPHEVEAAAFAAMIDKVSGEFAQDVLYGDPPQAAEPATPVVLHG